MTFTHVTLSNGNQILINGDQIVHMETMPKGSNWNTKITFSTGEEIGVNESEEEILDALQASAERII